MKLVLHSIEHRWGDRLKTNLRVHFAAAPIRHIPARLTDISLSGAFMETAFDVRLNSLVEIVIEGDACAERPVYAYVTRTASLGVGVEWCVFGPAQVRDLIRASTSRVAAQQLVAY